MNYDKIKNAAYERNITMKALAEAVGLSYNGLSLSFKNDTLKVKDLEKIAKVLDLPISYFFNDSGFLSELSEANKQKLQNYNTMADFYYFLEFIDICNKTELNKFFKNEIKNLELVETPLFSQLMSHFMNIERKHEAIVSLFEYVSQDKFKQGRLSKDISSIYRQWYVNYMSNRNMKKQP